MTTRTRVVRQEQIPEPRNIRYEVCVKIYFILYFPKNIIKEFENYKDTY